MNNFESKAKSVKKYHQSTPYWSQMEILKNFMHFSYTYYESAFAKQSEELQNV